MIQKIYFKPSKDLEQLSEFNYNISKKNFVKEGLVYIILSDRRADIYINKLLSEGYSVIKIKEVLKNYKFGYNIINIYAKLNNSNILEIIEKKCKISCDYINNITSLNYIITLKNEFKGVNFFNKPLIYFDLLNREKKLKLS